MAECQDVGRLLQGVGQLVEYAHHVDSWHYRIWEPNTTKYLLPYMTGTTIFLQGSGLGGGFGLVYNSGSEQWETVVWDERSHEMTVKAAHSDMAVAGRIAMFRCYSNNVRVPGVKNLYREWAARGVHPATIVSELPSGFPIRDNDEDGFWSLVSLKDDPSVWTVVESIWVEGTSQLLAASLSDVVGALMAGLPGAPEPRRYPEFSTDDPMTAPSVADVLSEASSVGGALRNLVDVFRGRDIGDQVDARLTGGGWFQVGDADSPWLIWVDGQLFRAGQVGDTPPADGAGFPGFASLAQARRFVLWQHGDALRQRLDLPSAAPAIAAFGPNAAFRVEQASDGSSVLLSVDDPDRRVFLPQGLNPAIVTNVISTLDARLLSALGEGL